MVHNKRQKIRIIVPQIFFGFLGFITYVLVINSKITIFHFAVTIFANEGLSLLSIRPSYDRVREENVKLKKKSKWKNSLGPD